MNQTNIDGMPNGQAEIDLEANHQDRSGQILVMDDACNKPQKIKSNAGYQHTFAKNSA